MDERAARDVALAHAIEATDDAHQLLRSEERRQASLSARNMNALRQDAPDAAGAFLHTRAALLLDGLERRVPALGAARRPYRLGALAGWLLPLLALLAGALTERVANPHRMDLLSLPLLGVLGWNLLMYLGLAATPAIPALRRRVRPPAFGLPARWPWTRRPPPALAAALARFAADWQALSAPLAIARGKRILHLAAALFGLGVAGSLYARGLIVEYRVGWESTFLGAPQVRALLNALFAPAAWLLQLPRFSLEEVEALRFSATGGVADGARWVHLYATLLGLVVVVPRLLLAGLARWRERRLARDFPLDLGQPYYRKLLGALSPEPLRLNVVPYSLAVDASREAGLQALARDMLGETAQAALLPAWEYGAEPGEAPPNDMPATVTAALVNLSATPERESHGAFLAHLSQALPGKLVLAVDQSSYAARLAGHADAARRLEERKRLWQDFGTLHQVPVTFVDLLQASDG